MYIMIIVIIFFCVASNRRSHPTPNVPKSWYAFNHLVGWGFPLVIALTICVTVLTKGEEAEFLLEQDVKYIPLTLLWLANVSLCCIALYTASKNTSEERYQDVIRYRSRLNIKLFFFSGFLWIFEIVAYFSQYKFYHFW